MYSFSLERETDPRTSMDGTFNINFTGMATFSILDGDRVVYSTYDTYEEMVKLYNGVVHITAEASNIDSPVRQMPGSIRDNINSF